MSFSTDHTKLSDGRDVPVTASPQPLILIEEKKAVFHHKLNGRTGDVLAGKPDEKYQWLIDNGYGVSADFEQVYAQIRTNVLSLEEELLLGRGIIPLLSDANGNDLRWNYTDATPALLEKDVHAWMRLRLWTRFNQTDFQEGQIEEAYRTHFFRADGRFLDHTSRPNMRAVITPTFITYVDLDSLDKPVVLQTRTEWDST